METPVLILFNFTPARVLEIGPCAQKCGFALRRAANSEHRRPLMSILGAAPPEDVMTLPAFGDEMMVFSAPDRDRVFMFLSCLREHGVRPPALKAVLTENNLLWTPERLCAELRQEHAALHAADGQKQDG